MEGQKFAGNPQLKPSVVLKGTAKEGSVDVVRVKVPTFSELQFLVSRKIKVR